ncbi:MAG: hypothetical protein GY799_16935 [Desulfobulbaceae bacterium]|nr:hypothetical protein [Desulfobulbaceae bacterium]
MAKKKTKAYSEAFRKQTEKSAHHDISRLFWRFWSNNSEIISYFSGYVMKKKIVRCQHNCRHDFFWSFYNACQAGSAL